MAATRTVHLTATWLPLGDGGELLASFVFFFGQTLSKTGFDGAVRRVLGLPELADQTPSRRPHDGGAPVELRGLGSLSPIREADELEFSASARRRRPVFRVIRVAAPQGGRLLRVAAPQGVFFASRGVVVFDLGARGVARDAYRRRGAATRRRGARRRRGRGSAAASTRRGRALGRPRTSAAPRRGNQTSRRACFARGVDRARVRSFPKSSRRKFSATSARRRRQLGAARGHAPVKKSRAVRGGVLVERGVVVARRPRAVAARPRARRVGRPPRPRRAARRGGPALGRSTAPRRGREPAREPTRLVAGPGLARERPRSTRPDSKNYFRRDVQREHRTQATTPTPSRSSRSCWGFGPPRARRASRRPFC